MSPRPVPTVAALAIATVLAVGSSARADAPPRRRAVVTALAIEGELEPAWRLEFERRLRTGLERGDAEVVDPETPARCRDAACWRAVAEAADAEHVIVSALAVVGRDYEIRIDVRARRDGEVVAHVEQRCELCGLGEAATRLSDVAAAIADDLDALGAAIAVLDIRSTPAGAAIDLDGRRVGTAPLPLEVDAGRHTLRASLQGFHPQVRDVDAATGVRQIVRFTLVEAPPDRPHLRRFTPFALGLGTAGIIAGAALLAIDERPIRHRCTGENVNPLGICKYRYDTLAGGAVLLASGAAMAIAGTVLAVVLRKAAKRRRGGRW